ncbi:MAG: hypothetical protein EXX96DRAFT_481550 [Benjaminiella poitrasii]|nr:MAG: hypothetical protein EXX96DRAFT_481550 [Benjaminiella poitrasii]
MTTATEQIFANNFWGLKDEGFHVLTAKMNSNKKTYEEIKSFYSTSTLRTLLISAHQETEWTAQAHLNLAQKLKTRLEVDLDNFILEQKDKRKLAHTNVEKAHRYKQSSEAYLAKAKENHIVIIIIFNFILEQEYKNACIKSADATEAWNTAWKLACDTYQEMEKKKLEFIHHSFAMYVNILSSATSQDQESYERFWKSLDQYDSTKDIQTFIMEKGTGPKIPEPEIFVDYMDDPAKTFQQHKIANFPVPPKLITSPVIIEQEPQKPELTIKNTVVDKHERPMMPSKSTSVRKKSIVRSIIKPLPSISTPLIRQQKTSPSSQESTTDSSDEDEEDNSRLDRKKNDQGEEGDIAIDPRAKVVFAIGNNMFDLGHLDLDDTTLDNTLTNSKIKSSALLSKSRSASTTRRRQPSADLEAACNFSYQSLLEELGVYDKNENKHDENNSNKNQISNTNNHSSPQQGPKPTDTYPLNKNDPYIHARQQQHYVQQQYYRPAYPGAKTGVGHHQQQSINRFNNYRPNNDYYQPPTNVLPGSKPTLFWVLTLRDWYSGKPDELQFSRGTWLAVTEARADGWYYAVKFDSRINSLTNEQGYVPQNMVQVYSTTA